MVIARLRGGLGNQLFQYAAAKALALHHGTSMKLDLYTYLKHPYRKFELHHFNIDASEASRTEVHRFTGANKVVRYLNKRENYFRCPHVFAQPHYHFYDDFFNLPAEIYLSGYWQSEKYFQHITPLIRQTFQPAKGLDPRNLELLGKIKETNSVSLHVRRGDYTAAGYDKFYGGLSTEYYKSAVARINESVPNPVFYVFSDAIGWCRQNLDIGPAVYIDNNAGADAWKDLALMASCRHNVIANSTFSWWGAWLNPAVDKKVIAPTNWFQQSYSEKKEPVYPCRYYNTKDIIPESWTRI